MSKKNNLRTKIPESAVKVFEGVIFDIYQWQQELYDGSFATFEMASRADAVSITAIVDDKILVIHEEQPTSPLRTGFPAGHIEPGEDPLEAAKRELQEETGMVFRDFKLVQVEDIGGGKVDWWAYRYIATGLVEQGEQQLDAGEKIDSELVPFDEAKKLAENNLFMSFRLMESVKSLEELLEYPEFTDDSLVTTHF